MFIWRQAARMFALLSFFSAAGLSARIFCILRAAVSQAHRHRLLAYDIYALFSVSALSGRDGSFNTMGVFPGSGNAQADYGSTWAKHRDFLVKPGKAEPDFMVDDECSRLHLGCSATKWISAK